MIHPSVCLSLASGALHTLRVRSTGILLIGYPAELQLPENVPDALKAQSLEIYRHYLAMTLTVDDMLGELMAYLESTGRVENTLLVFRLRPRPRKAVRAKASISGRSANLTKNPIKVPLIMRLPGVFDGNRTCDTLTSPVDLFPSLCGLCGIQPPRTVEGYDLSASWRAETDAYEQGAVLTMNFGSTYDYLIDGNEWRGVRTKTHSYARWLDGKRMLYDVAADPLQMNNLIGASEAEALADEMEDTLTNLMGCPQRQTPARHELYRLV